MMKWHLRAAGVQERVPLLIGDLTAWRRWRGAQEPDDSFEATQGVVGVSELDGRPCVPFEYDGVSRQQAHALAPALVDAALERHRHEKSHWEQPIEHDRLSEALCALDSGGVVTREDFGATVSDAERCVWAEAAREVTNGVQVGGVCSFNRQEPGTDHPHVEICRDQKRGTVVASFDVEGDRTKPATDMQTRVYCVRVSARSGERYGKPGPTQKLVVEPRAKVHTAHFDLEGPHAEMR